jgi:hypothetical protein
MNRVSEPAGAPAGTVHTSGRSHAIRLLGFAVVATALGMTAATFRGDGTAINAYLFLTGELSHGAAARIERIAMSIVLALSLAALIRPHCALLLPVSGYMLAEALARRHELGYVFSEWALTAQAPRYLTPLAIVFLIAGFRRAELFSWCRIGGAAILRVALALVFAVHGLEALKAHPEFVDLVISSAANLFGVRVSERTVTLALDVIGILDLAVAAGILFRPHPAVLWWAAFWGALTALSRVTAYGLGAYPEVLVRMTHALAPVALWWLARAATSKRNLLHQSPEVEASVSARKRDLEGIEPGTV